MRTGVAISTTGQDHRIPLLVESVRHWDDVLGHGDSLFVTVDGTEEETAHVRRVLADWTESVARVGQPKVDPSYEGMVVLPRRQGVAANKNTGLELLMENTSCEQFWLSDDDAWPKTSEALDLHRDLRLGHSLVCWGSHRRKSVTGRVASWRWPRGAVMYATRAVVNRVGGMVEAFGTGGHEHVEWSDRIHNVGFTPVPYPSPVEYAHSGWLGSRPFWHCEDMPLAGESLGMLRRRRDKITSMNREPGHQRQSDALMAEMKDSTDFVSYRAADNRRQSATMSDT